MVLTEKIAIIGGSGVKDSPIFQDIPWKPFDTEFRTAHGDGIVEYQETEDGVIFIPRHGRREYEEGKLIRDRGYGPCKTQYGANIITARALGAKATIGTSAVGVFNNSARIESLVIPQDYIDESWRDPNFFGKSFVVHANRRPAFSEGLRKILIECAYELRGEFTGTFDNLVYVTIPGDDFGTAAEGRKRSKYADIVGMTACPEASMAMQLGMHYAILAFPVDNDDDANHEGGTLKVMEKMSLPHRVPALMTRVVEKAKEASWDEPLKQLRKNCIEGDTSRIENKYLRKFADELIKTYCK